MQNTQAAIDHLRTHQAKWPATYEELVAECNNLSDFSPEDKKEFMEKLPRKTYNSADEVIAAMGWSDQKGQGGQMGQGGMGGQPPGQGGQM